MTDYRFYWLDKRGKVSTPPAILKCRDDSEAAHGQSIVGEFPIDIWRAAAGCRSFPAPDVNLAKVTEPHRRPKRFLSLRDRFALYASEISKKAAELPPGSDKDALLRKARQADTAASHLDEWLQKTRL
jgi:hypothetical protein